MVREKTWGQGGLVSQLQLKLQKKTLLIWYFLLNTSIMRYYCER